MSFHAHIERLAEPLKQLLCIVWLFSGKASQDQALHDASERLIDYRILHESQLKVRNALLSHDLDELSKEAFVLPIGVCAARCGALHVCVLEQQGRMIDYVFEDLDIVDIRHLYFEDELHQLIAKGPDNRGLALDNLDDPALRQQIIVKELGISMRIRVDEVEGLEVLEPAKRL